MNMGQRVDGGFALMFRRREGPGLMVMSSTQIFEHDSPGSFGIVINRGEALGYWRTRENGRDSTIKLQLAAAMIVVTRLHKRCFDHEVARQTTRCIRRVCRSQKYKLRQIGLVFEVDMNVSDVSASQSA
jgi:hypothetical protein